MTSVPSEIIVVPAVFGSLVVLFRTWIRHKQWMAALPRGTAASAPLEQRVQRIESAVEAIGLEIERIGEGQRFVTRLLTDRASVTQSDLGGGS